MMHQTIRNKLLRCLDGELSEKERLEMRSHIETCGTCRNVLQELESLWRTEQQIKRIDPPPFLWTRICNRLDQEGKRNLVGRIKVRGFPAARPLILAAGILILMIAGIQLGSRMTRLASRSDDMAALDARDSFGANYFDVLPPGSIDARFLGLTESEKKE